MSVIVLFKVRLQTLTIEDDIFNDGAGSGCTLGINDGFEISPSQASGDLALDIDKNASGEYQLSLIS